VSLGREPALCILSDAHQHLHLEVGAVARLELLGVRDHLRVVAPDADPVVAVFEQVRQILPVGLVDRRLLRVGDL
jgi:hypothetical protein